MTLASSRAIQLAPGIYREALTETINKFEIKNLAEFLGTVYYESNYLNNIVENLNYASDALLKKFSRKRISYEQAMRYGRSQTQSAKQQTIANCIYGGQWGKDNLGNTKDGDGWLFRGRGPIQLTGRENWGKFGKYIGRPDVGENPELIMGHPDLICFTAGFFWAKFKKTNECGSDMRAVTKIVTGASDTAIKTRIAYRDRIKQLL